MVTYVIASKANQPYLAECQMLGEMLEKNCPDVSIKTVIKHQSEWPEFLDSVCRSYGFADKTCPLIFTLEGTLIGDGSGFVEHIREKYGKVLSMSKETQQKRTRENMANIQEEMRKKKDGLTLNETILKHLDKVKKKAAIQHINDAFFKEEIERGTLFYVRRTNLQRESRTVNVKDEIAEAQAEEERLQAIEAARDMTYDEFQQQFLDHIEGRASNKRYRSSSALEDDGDASKKVKNAAKQSNVDEEEEHEDEEEEEKGDAESKADEEVKSGTARARTQESNRSGTSKKGEGGAMDGQAEEYDLPETCLLRMMKSLKIEKLDKKYVLAVHPFPIIEGEMLIFATRKADQDVKDLITYRDYSLRKRLPTKEAKKTDAMGQAIKKSNDHDNWLQCLEIDLKMPMSKVDWRNFADVLNEVQGLGWFQVLPVGQKSSQPYQFNVMHVIPSVKMPVQQLPLDVMIANTISYQRKADREKQKDLSNLRIDDIKRTDRERMEVEAQQQGLIMINEFQFDHVVFQISDAVLTEEGLDYAYQKCMKFLKLYDKPDLGLTVLLSPKWLFMSVLTAPYASSDHDFPCYLDGFAFAGLFNIQTISKKWPATADLVDDKISLFGAIEKSTHQEPPKQEEPEISQVIEKSMTSPKSVKSSSKVA